MANEDIQGMIDSPGLYFIAVEGRPELGDVLVVSQEGKLYALSVDQELSPDRFHPRAFISKKVESPTKKFGTLDDGGLHG